MKLHAEPKFRRGRAAELLRTEAEPEFDLRAVALTKAEEMQEQLADAEQKLQPIAYMKGSLHRLAGIRTVEISLGVTIIPTVENQELDRQAHELMSHQGEVDWANAEYDQRHFASLVAWVQLFPDERAVVDTIMDDQRFERAFASWKRGESAMSYLREAVFLLQLRPDKRQQILEVVTRKYFEEFTMGNFKESYLLSEAGVETYTEWLADYLLIHPEDREQFQPTETEAKIIQQALNSGPKVVHPTGGRLRDAAIIFAHDAQIDDRGVIHISHAAPAVGGRRVELPVRPLT